MREISSQTKKRIFELYFKGYRRDVIARRTGVSTGTVSNVVSLLPGSVKELRTLSVEVRESGKSVHEVLEGAKLCRRLKEMNVGLTQLEGYVNSSKRLSRKGGYEPRQVVQAEMRLSDLEAKSGKSFQEALEAFETKTIQIKDLEYKKGELEREIRKIVEKRKQERRLNRVTDKEIRYLKELRRKLRKQGISLTDVEDLKKYLKNMEETGGNPRKFVKFTRKYGSLKGRSTYLENHKRKKKLELDRTKKEIENVEVELDLLKIRVSELRTEEGKITERLETVKNEVKEQKIKLEATVAALADMLRVKANVEDMNKAINAQVQKLHDQKAVLSAMESKIQELEGKRQDLEREVKDILKIKNYAVGLNKALSNLEKQKSVLEKEVAEKSERLALADATTNFLTRQPAYDFNRFYSMVETVKRTREDEKSPFRVLLPRIEEKIRMQALQAFKGDLVPKPLFKRVLKQREELKGKNAELEKKLKFTEDKLTDAEREKEELARIEVYVEGGPRTLKELRDWSVAVFKEEVERRANEKYDALAALVQGTFDWIQKKRR